MIEIVRERGPLTVAAFMDLALYDPELGYYARAAQRSGRAGDFFTSVDVGPLFGELLEIAARRDGAHSRIRESPDSSSFRPRRSRRRQRPARRPTSCARRARSDPDSTTRSGCIWSKPARRRAPRSAATLGDVADRLASSSDVAAGVVRRRADRERAARRAAGPSGRDARGWPARGLRRRRDSGDSGLRLTSSRARRRRRRSPSTSIASASRSSRAGASRSTCARVDWIRDAARRLRRGFIILIDYGHEARELYSPTHAAGTLTTFARHHDAAARNRRATRRRGCSIPASRTSPRTSTSPACAPRPKPRA